MRTVVFGSAGQLGSELIQHLRSQGSLAREVLTPGRDQTDFCQPEQLLAYLNTYQPDVVVNCAAYNFVDRAEIESGIAFAINASAPGTLAQWCGDHQRYLVHVSTDHVFGREVQRTPYQEGDPPSPTNLYGTSKWAGEALVRARCSRYLIVRTCGLYGRLKTTGSTGKGNFVNTMLRLAREGKPLRVVDDQVCAPTSVVELVPALLALLHALVQGAPSGVYHRTCAGECSWHQLAQAIFELTQISADLQPISTLEYQAQQSGRGVLVAPRPAYSVLGNEAARSLNLASLRPWKECLAEYLARMPLGEV